MSIKLGDFSILKIKINGQVVYKEKDILVPTKENITRTLLDKNMRELTK